MDGKDLMQYGGAVAALLIFVWYLTKKLIPKIFSIMSEERKTWVTEMAEERKLCRQAIENLADKFDGMKSELVSILKKKK